MTKRREPVIMSSFVDAFIGDTWKFTRHTHARQSSMVALITNSEFSVITTK